MTGSSSNTDTAIQNLVSEFLELLADDTRRLVYLAAIPQAVHPELLQKMAAEPIDTANVLETLEEYYLINQGEGDWYSFPPATREVLLAVWKRPDQLSEFKTANQVAFGYFSRLAEQTPSPGCFVFQREALYHRLLAEESMGLEYMAEVFEQAYDQRQIGAAQNFSIQLSQLDSWLSPTGAQHAAYYEMRLDFLLNRRDKLQENIQALIYEATDPLLKARAGILLGQTLLTQYEWKKAADVLRSSLNVLKNLSAWRYAARAMLVLGDVYVDLVRNCGGVEPEKSRRFSRPSEFLSGLMLLPFLLLDWLKRKVWFMPGWFSFNVSYQDWILNYLLQMAGRWYRQARRMAHQVNDDAATLQALLGEAHVAVQQRRESKAQRSYSRLAKLSAVRLSKYRSAQVVYGQGQISLLANQAVKAAQQFQDALAVFRSFADEERVAVVAHALGTAFLRLGQIDSAASAFLESFRAAGEMRDHIFQTQITWDLEKLLENKSLPISLETPVEDALQSMSEKQYLARFPAGLLQRFRTLAYWVSLPLSYLLILVVGLFISVALIGMESSALEYSTTGILSQSNIVFLFVVGVLPVFLAFWITGLMYAVIGHGWIFFAGQRSLDSLAEQPDRIVVKPEGLLIDRSGLDRAMQFDWRQIEKFVSADYKLWQRPMTLLSRLGLVVGSKPVIIDGITSGYLQLRKDILKRIDNRVEQWNSDLILLAHPSTYMALLIAVLHAQWIVSLGVFDITVENEEIGAIFHLVLSRLLVFSIINLILILPPLFLWRIYFQRHSLEAHLGESSDALRNVLRVSIAMILSILALLWLSLSPVLRAGNDEVSMNRTMIQQTVSTSDPAAGYTHLDQ